MFRLYRGHIRKMEKNMETRAIIGSIGTGLEFNILGV